MRKEYFVMTVGIIILLGIFYPRRAEVKAEDVQKIKLYNAATKTYEEAAPIVKTEDEWKKILTPIQFEVTRKHGTERPRTGELWDNHKKGSYKCIGCGTDLFSSETKFESGTGWPSFYQPIAKENVETRDDSAFFMHRTEVHCPRCAAHLGHVFDDGPAPTHKRFCMNSAALKFVEEK